MAFVDMNDLLSLQDFLLFVALSVPVLGLFVLALFAPALLDAWRKHKR